MSSIAIIRGFVMEIALVILFVYWYLAFKPGEMSTFYVHPYAYLFFKFHLSYLLLLRAPSIQHLINGMRSIKSNYLQIFSKLALSFHSSFIFQIHSIAFCILFLIIPHLCLLIGGCKVHIYVIMFHSWKLLWLWKQRKLRKECLNIKLFIWVLTPERII